MLKRGDRRVRIAVEDLRISAQGAVGVDEAARRQGHAALRGDQDLAFGDDGSREIEEQRRLPRGAAGDADGHRVGRHASVDATERGNQEAAADVDEMDRDHPGFQRPLRPVADPSQVAGIAQGHDGDPVRPGLGDADVDRLRADGLAEAVIAIDHRHRLGVGDDGDVLPGLHGAGLHPHQVTGHADDAVAVVAGQVGLDQVAADALTLVGGAAGGGEGVADETAQGFGVDDGHGAPGMGQRMRAR